MSAGPAPTRMNLLRALKRLERVRKGVHLLRRKREALVAELFRLARPASDAREQIVARARRAYPALLGALALHGRSGLRALGWPTREVAVRVDGVSLWGIPVTRIVARTPVARSLAARGTAPGSTGPAVALATTEFEALVDLLLDAAPREMLLRRLGQAVAQASRQVNALERRLAPGLAADVTRVRRTLEEREREERMRLKRLVRAPGGRSSRPSAGAPSPA